MPSSQGGVAGFAIHQHHPSTWIAGDDCYLEDLHVDESQRGSGIGRALIDDLRARASALYDSYTPEDGHVRYRVTL